MDYYCMIVAGVALPRADELLVAEPDHLRGCKILYRFIM